MKKMQSSHLLVLCAGLITIPLILLLYFYLSSPNVITTGDNRWGGPEQFGQFGDMLGGVLNPILSFVTVVILIYNLQMQIKLNEEQRAKNELTLITEILHDKKSELDSLTTTEYIYRADGHTGTVEKFTLSTLTTNKDSNRIYIDHIINSISGRERPISKYADCRGTEEVISYGILYSTRGLIADIFELEKRSIELEKNIAFKNNTKIKLKKLLTKYLHMGILSDREFSQFLSENDNTIESEPNFVSLIKYQ
jgi:hypothetical protein